MIMSKLHISTVAYTSEFQLVDFYIDSNGILEPTDLESIKLPSGIEYTKGIIFSGKGPVWLFSHLVHLAHIAAWVATFDPRHGAVVVQTHHPAVRVGEIIPVDHIKLLLPRHPDQRQTQVEHKMPSGMVVAFLGPPHSGKSVLVQQLYERLRATMGAEEFQKQCFVLRACPDGEGDWYSDIPIEFGKVLRYKNTFDDAFVETVCNNVLTTAKTKKILFVDCGGKIDKKNQQILNCCTHAILVSHSLSALAEWRGAVRASEVALLAEIESVQQPLYEVLSEHPLQLRIGKLERGETVTYSYDELLAVLQPS